jgi:hypothetical protein
MVAGARIKTRESVSSRCKLSHQLFKTFKTTLSTLKVKFTMMQRRMSEVLIASPVDSQVLVPRLVRTSSALFSPRDILAEPKFEDAVQVQFVDGEFSSSLRAVKNFDAGDVVADLSLHAWVTPKKRYTTVQAGKNKHIELGSEMVFCNHSCSPNVHFDMSRMCTVAIKPIHAGDELVFFYPSSEWEMDQPFQCWCGSSACVGWIAGARFLSPTVLGNFKYINDHIKELKEEQLAELEIKEHVGQDL